MSEKRALIVDDEPDIRELLEITLGRMNVDTVAAENVATAKRYLDEGSFDLCLTDMQLPDGNGIDLVTHISSEYPALPVAVITAFGSVDTAISALKAGAFDYVQKPVELDALRSLVDTALRVDPHAASDGASTQLTGESAVMKALKAQIAKLARSQAPIYISGESGAGKEVAARLIHELGPRAEGPFVPVNCGAIPAELMESEFFGHLKGSFTGAVVDKEGLFQAAEGGTLFLDEVADLPLPMQVKLLRAIQEKAVRPVGSQAEVGIDVRVLSATHKDLAALVADGDFRQDLYYRINVIELAMPSLRDRVDDIEPLMEQILTRLAEEYGGTKPRVSAAALDTLRAYEFPGNVRELENILERAYTLCDNDVIDTADLNLGSQVVEQELEAYAGPEHGSVAPAIIDPEAAVDADAALPQGESLESYMDSIEKQLITDALNATRWNKTAAAKQLGITFRALRYRLKKLGLD